MHPVVKGEILAEVAASILPVWPSLWPGRLGREEGPPPKGWPVPVPDPRSGGPEGQTHQTCLDHFTIARKEEKL